MDKTTVIDSLRKFRVALEAQGIRAVKIILFGSYARGTSGPDSDIDTVVISEDFADKDFWERIVLLSRAIRVSNILIEAVALTPEEWENDNLTIREYAKDGEIIAA